MSVPPPAEPAAAARRVPRNTLAVALLTLVVLAWAAALAAALWADLTPAERAAIGPALATRKGAVLAFALLLPALLAGLAWPWIARWPRAARRLREEVAIVTSAHAGHRMTVEGAPEMRELARAVDALAQSHAALRHEVDARIAAANARLAQETRRLAALMSRLPQGVLVCNREARVLLYNDRAAQVLGADAAGGTAPGSAALLGLGRPVAGLIDADALAHGWHQLLHRRARGRTHAVAQFVTARRRGTGSLLRVQMVPIAADDDAAGEPDGYVLLVEDITRAVEEQGRRDALVQRLTEGTRSALGNLRAAAQTLQRYPSMAGEQRERLTAVVHDETERLAQQLGAALAEPGGAATTGWPREDMQVGDLVFALQRSFEAGLGVACRSEHGAAQRWLEVDSHALVQWLTHLVGRLRAELDVREVRLEVIESPRFVRLDIAWNGPPLAARQLQAWEAADAIGQAGATAWREVLDHHGAELWAQADDGALARLCLQLAAADGAPESADSAAVSARPISYDFDLFNQPGQTAALDETPLAALAFTVFDTETTGLAPSAGDEIISIGAVRIVNGKLLQQECFDRLTRPRRAVRASAQAVHGISDERLEREQPLEQVLPQFARFAEGTVLVAHNAAFDMRFLELARERTGVRFDQPVLDTLLLSAVVHPEHRGSEHELERIAARLGVAVARRHEALADALVTGRVFLKLLPLLAERGIVTLGQARTASQRTLLAREKF
jgi:DNA polymerase-3 subunit epsilon